jgi:hypothetical protein
MLAAGGSVSSCRVRRWTRSHGPSDGMNQATDAVTPNHVLGLADERYGERHVITGSERAGTMPMPPRRGLAVPCRASERRGRRPTGAARA